MAHRQETSTDWMLTNLKDAVGARARDVKETGKAALGASRAVMEVWRETASILQDRNSDALRTGTAAIQAGFDANSQQLNRMAESKNLQDFVHLQMMWGANQTLAICHALNKANKAELSRGDPHSRTVTA